LNVKQRAARRWTNAGNGVLGALLQQLAHPVSALGHEALLLGQLELQGRAVPTAEQAVEEMNAELAADFGVQAGGAEDRAAGVASPRGAAAGPAGAGRGQ
jgi:hypothetical protein